MRYLRKGFLSMYGTPAWVFVAICRLQRIVCSKNVCCVFPAVVTLVASRRRGGVVCVDRLRRRERRLALERCRRWPPSYSRRGPSHIAKSLFSRSSLRAFAGKNMPILLKHTNRSFCQKLIKTRTKDVECWEFYDWRFRDRLKRQSRST